MGPPRSNRPLNSGQAVPASLPIRSLSCSAFHYKATQFMASFELSPSNDITNGIIQLTVSLLRHLGGGGGFAASANANTTVSTTHRATRFLQKQCALVLKAE
jgi:hypothetical protein